MALQTRLAELGELLTLFPEDTPEIQTEIDALETDLHALEQAAMTPTGSAYDDYPALFTIAAGVGGLEASDFARMLLRMYLRYFEKQHIEYEVLEMVPVGDAGIKQATLQFNTPGAYAQLIGQAGTHRLTRVSPYNAAGKKQTSFAAIEVLPLLDAVSVQIDVADLKWDTFHSGGPGGQGVNTTDSAVRLTHKPTGLTVNIQGRSQTMNRKTAVQVLGSRLHELQARDRHAELQSARGDRKGSWGTQVRTYNLAGGQYVKNNQDGFTRHDVARVLDGDLTGFMPEGA